VVCSRCYQVVVPRTWRRHKQHGTLPGCRAHGKHAHAGPRAFVAALTEAGHQCGIWYEQTEHSHGKVSHSRGRFTNKPTFRVAMRFVCAGGAVLAVEFDGHEHLAHAQNRLMRAKSHECAIRSLLCPMTEMIPGML
jgi:hypothetical protein